MVSNTILTCDKCGEELEPDKGIRILRLSTGKDFIWWNPTGEFCSTRCAISKLIEWMRKEGYND